MPPLPGRGLVRSTFSLASRAMTKLLSMAPLFPFMRARSFPSPQKEFASALGAGRMNVDGLGGCVMRRRRHAQQLIQTLCGEQAVGQPCKISAAHQKPGGGEGTQRSREVTSGDSRALRDGSDVLNDLRGPL